MPPSPSDVFIINSPPLSEISSNCQFSVTPASPLGERTSVQDRPAISPVQFWNDSPPNPGVSNASFTKQDVLKAIGNAPHELLVNYGNEAYMAAITSRDNFHRELKILRERNSAFENILGELRDIKTSLAQSKTLTGATTNRQDISLSGLNPDDYPLVSSWYMRTWIEISKDLQPNGSHNPKGRSGVAANEDNTCQWIQDINGNPVNSDTLTHIGHHMRDIWADLFSKGCAPEKWGDAGIPVINHFRIQMYRRFRFLQYCENNWKVDHLATTTYPGWYRHTKNRMNASKTTVGDIQENSTTNLHTVLVANAAMNKRQFPDTDPELFSRPKKKAKQQNDTAISQPVSAPGLAGVPSAPLLPHVVPLPVPDADAHPRSAPAVISLLAKVSLPTSSTYLKNEIAPAPSLNNPNTGSLSTSLPRDIIPPPAPRPPFSVLSPPVPVIANNISLSEAQSQPVTLSLDNMDSLHPPLSASCPPSMLFAASSSIGDTQTSHYFPVLNPLKNILQSSPSRAVSKTQTSTRKSSRQLIPTKNADGYHRSSKESKVMRPDHKSITARGLYAIDYCKQNPGITCATFNVVWKAIDPEIKKEYTEKSNWKKKAVEAAKEQVSNAANMN